MHLSYPTCRLLDYHPHHCTIYSLALGIFPNQNMHEIYYEIQGCYVACPIAPFMQVNLWDFQKSYYVHRLN